MQTSKYSISLIVAVTAMFAACTISSTPAPPLQGPSELGLSVTLTANPDVLSMDGASQSQITIKTFDQFGQPLPGVQMRAEIVANGTVVDFGSLSTKAPTTGSSGSVTIIYTAPISAPGPIPDLSIRLTPRETDAANSLGRSVSIRLVPPGVILGGGPSPAFTVTPAAPAAFSDVFFDASTSTPGLGAVITTYAWDFGDGGKATGLQATHKYTGGGTFRAVLTVTDSNNQSAAVSKDVQVTAGAAPTADFTFSPAAPNMNQDINFNAGTSKAGAGHSIVRYDWAFGSGSPQSGVTVTKQYDTAGTYSVLLTVTDEVGQTAAISKSVTVSAAAATTAEFTSSPTTPKVATAVNFDANPSRAQPGASIVSYDWIFGDGTTATTVAPTTQHTYATVNTFVVRLTVTDSKGATSQVTHNVTTSP